MKILKVKEWKKKKEEMKLVDPVTGKINWNFYVELMQAYTKNVGRIYPISETYSH